MAFRIAGAVTDGQVREFYESTPKNPTRLQAFLVAESLGRIDTIIASGYREVSEYLSHVEEDIRDGVREAPSGYQGEPKPATA